MQANKLFILIQNSSYKKSGDNVNWVIKIDDTEKIIRLLFQETKGKRDWINNFKFPKKPYKQQENTLWVHRGWGDAYASCNDLIMNECEKAIAQVPDYSFQISGWSCGGALALLAAEDLHFRTKIKPDVVTFGSPKPLYGKKTKNYVNSCINTCSQYANRNDIVPLQPPFYRYCVAKKVKVDKKVLFGLFNPWKYHQGYGNPKLYT